MKENTKASMLKYRKANREQIQIDVAKGVKAKVKAFAEQRGMSMSALIMQLLDNEMKADGFGAEWDAAESARLAAEQAEFERARQAVVDALKAENATALKR